MSMNILQLGIIAACLCAALSIVIHTQINGISPMPSSRKARAAILRLAQEFGVQGTIVDLGSGWGGPCAALSRALPHATVIGYENSWVPWLFSAAMNACLRRDNLRFACSDFFKAPLNTADLVICFLYPGGMTKLEPKFERELKSGAIVISNTFAIPEWKPERIVESGDIYRTRVYVYRAIGR
jgi:hypothetical protein